MIRLSCFLSLLFVVSVFGQTTPLLTVVSVVAGDYYTEVTVKMSQNGIVYVYPLPTEVQVAPDDLSIVTYGFSANVTAGVNSVIIVEELQAKSSYNLYVTGRDHNNQESSPSRIVKVVTTLAPTPPTLTISSYVANTESIILRYTMTAAGTIWCRAYREEESDYASVEGVYTSIQGSPVVAHVLSNYYIGNLEPNMVYHTFCVAENDRQIPMSTSFSSTKRIISTLVEPPYISYLGNRITYNSIEIDALTNVRANVWNYTVIRDENYDYPSVQTVKASTPTQVPRQQQFTMVWGSLFNDTEYAISLYSEDLKNNATEQSIPSTTFFITTDIVRCPPFESWDETAAGSFGLLPCSIGYSGNIKRYCDYEGEWGEVISECERNQCPSSSGWNATLSLTEETMPCGPGFTGTMSRYCNADGVWGAPDRSACVLLYCNAEGEWPRTPALSTHSIYCGTAFFGEKSRYCNENGEWDAIVEEECVPKQICPAEDGWASTYEGEYMVQSCPGGFHGSISRYCGLGGSWSTIFNNCTQNLCPESGMWPETIANTTVNFACPDGESGMITRYCSLDGIWHAMDTSQCVQIFCNEEGVWNRTLAGLTIPGPCRDGEFGSSSRTCSMSGVWQNIDYSECFEQGCAENDGWQAVPIGITLRRDCSPGFGGYRYRHCSSNGMWDVVNDADCERLYCTEMNGFPTTPSGVDVNVSCGEHYSGNMTATCSLYGQWVNIDISECEAIPTCEEDGIWPRTNMNSLRTLSCGAGVSGTKTRFCNSNLEWSEVDDSQCVQLYCAHDGNWPQTIAGIVAYLECPDDAFGFVQRPCSVDGVWGESDDSFCFETWCNAYQGWPATGGGQSATMPCSSGFVGIQTRYCLDSGEWDAVDDSNCIVATCPAEDVWPETIHSTPTIEKPCPIGYYGTMYRDCTLEGVWSPVDDSMCIRKSCLPDGTWPFTPSLTTLNQTCPLGYEGAIQRTCGDGVWGPVEYNCSPITCTEDNGWYTTAGSTQVRSCPYGYTGIMSRHCMIDGSWGIIEDSGCEQIKCPAFDNWQEGSVDETQVKPCSTGGFALLTCTIEGVWEGDPNQCYLHLCPADGKWPISTPGTVHRSTCPNGMDGYSTRYCSATGEWFEENNSQCVQTMCDAEENWPATPRDSWATIGCPSHATGLQTRFCDTRAEWFAPDMSACVNHSCAADKDWPMTLIGESVILTCGLGKRGYRSRICGTGGIWEEEDLSSCSQIVCYQDGEWPTTNALETAQLECPDGYVGAKNRTCSAGGVWEDVDDFCKQRTCEAEGIWPETVIDTISTIDCPQGYSGTFSRYCNITGIWGDADDSTCSRLHCAADGLWLTTNTFEYASIPCGGDLLGDITRYCKEDQTWAEPDSTQCRPNYCVAEGDWPNTPIGGNVTLPCGSGYRGMKTRTCGDEALWSEVDDMNCLQIPSMLILNSLPNSHFILFYTQFDINTIIYMYPRTSGSVAPSVSDVMTKGVNKTCEAHGVCKIYLTHLTPETKYDIYYWFVSEQGAEPISAVSTMKRIVSTHAIQPFNLTIHDIQGEFNHITIAASIEDRSGYLWCRASRVITVPTLSQLKSTNPVFFSEDNGILTKVISELDDTTEYHVYCYAEDIYGVPATNSIADTHYLITTLSEEFDYSISVDNTPTESNIYVVTNRDGRMCCDYRTDTTVPSYDEIMSISNCINLSAYDNNTLITPVMDDNDYLVYCAINTTTYVTVYEPENVISIHTPSLNPTYSFVSSMSAYNMIGLTFLADRSSMLYCWASTEFSQPSVDQIKQGASHNFIGGEISEIIILSLSKETLYQVYCYGETTEGLPMVNLLTNMTFTIETISEPPTISILSSSAQFDGVRLVISTTETASLRCIAIMDEHEVPKPIDFSEAEPLEISILGEYIISGLEENTSYSAYCFGEDTLGQGMLNSIASTQVQFTTLLNKHSIFTTFLSQSELEAYVSVVSSADGYVWCTVKHINDVFMSPSIIKQEISPVEVKHEVPTMISFYNLTAAYSYQAYCYSEDLRGVSMLTTVASTAVNITTPPYPVISLAISPISTNPSSLSIELDITSSQKGTVVCRAREILENELPPTNDWIRGGISLTITQESLVHYMRIGSLQPSTSYSVYCLGHSNDDYESIQPLVTRTISFVTLEDSIKPSVFITSEMASFIIPSQPYPVNITFSEPIQDFQQTSLVLTNCRVLTWNQISSQLYIATFAPITHGEFSIKVPAGAVKDLYDNTNMELILTRYYEPKNLLITVDEIGKLFVKASVSYAYPATVSCIHTTSSQAPSTCANLKLDSTVVSFNNLITTEVVFQDVSVNSISYLYCCAEEENGVLMNNSIQSTQAVVEVGWFDCPIVNDKVCNDQGSCTDGSTCICNTGYYGVNCTATCPGILHDNLLNYECSAHGTCNSNTLECTCSGSEYGGSDCSLLQLEGEVPATGYSFLYVSMNLQVSSSVVSSYQYLKNKEHFAQTVSSFIGLSSRDLRIQRWNVNTIARSLAADNGNVQIVVNVKEGEVDSKLNTLKSDSSTLQEQLTTDSFDVTSVAVTKSYVTSSSNTDPYTCYDGELSSGEADIDCGGSCLTKCAKNQRCYKNEDCETNYCQDNLCMSSFSGGMIALIVLICLFVIAFIVLLFVLSHSRKNEKAAAQTEIEMVRVRKQQEMRDLEKQDKIEEEEIKKLEEKAAKKAAKTSKEDKPEKEKSKPEEKDEPKPKEKDEPKPEISTNPNSEV